MTAPGSLRAVPWWWMLLPVVASAWVRDLWAPDEPRYAEVAREVFERGDFLVMHLCGDLYPDKPPLLFWLSGLFGWLSGWSEFWMRLPSLAATAGSAWLIARIARRWWGEVEAAWSAAIFLTLAMVVELGGRLQIDPLLTCCCLLAIEALTLPHPDPRIRARWVLLGGLALGFGALAKGPLVYVNVGFVLLAWRVAGVGARGAKLARWVWPSALALSILPVAAWAIGASLADNRLFQALFFDQHVGRIAKPDRHPGAWYKHLLRVPPLLLPWTFVACAALTAGFREIRRRAEEGADRGLIRAALWFGVLFVFFSAIPPKRDLYLLPAYPAVALLCARYLALRVATHTVPKWIGRTTGGLFCLLGLLLIAVAFARADLLPGLQWRGAVLALTILLGGVLGLRWSARGDHQRWLLSIAATWVLFTTLIALLVFAPLNGKKSGRDLAVEVAALPQRPAEIPCVGVRPEAYRFYGGLPTVYAMGSLPGRARDGAENLTLADHLDREGAEFLGMATEAEWQALDETQRKRMEILLRRQVGSKKVVVLGAVAAGSAGPQG